MAAFIRLDEVPSGAGEGRRRAVLEFNAEALVGFLRSLDGTRRHKIAGIPDDAKVIAVETSPSYGQGDPMILVYLWSASFELVPLGVMAPRFSITDEIIVDEPAVLRG